MKAFESCLAPMLEEYLDYRVGLGYVDKQHRCLLRNFDRYVYAHQRHLRGESFTPDFFVAFAAELKQSPRTVNAILSSVRCFFAYQVRLERILINPLEHLPACKEMAYIPFIFSPDQTQQLLTSIQGQIRHDERYFLRDLGTYVTFQLIADLGLRRTEPLRLLRHHYRSKEATIYIERSKFGKDRLIPITCQCKNALDNYLWVRQALVKDDGNPFLIAGQHNRCLGEDALFKVFHRTLDECGLSTPRRIIANTRFSAPVIHSLRHSFAINTLKRSKLMHKSPQHTLPILAAFMGHCHYRYTAKYLKLLDAEQHRTLVDFAVRSNGLS
jgi:integrase/recombinase XerD